MTNQEDKRKKYSWDTSDVEILKIPKDKELEKIIKEKQNKRLKELREKMSEDLGY